MKRSKHRRKKKEIGVFVDGVLIGVLAKDLPDVATKSSDGWIETRLAKSQKNREFLNNISFE